MKRNTTLVILLSIFLGLNAQGFLRTQGIKIVNEEGENVLLRGIGTGNWMIMEGYMMETDNVANTHTQFRNKLIETIGVEKTDSFYNVWLQNHMTRTDVDSMKAWGFNSVRAALHYKWFTLPIEDELVEGENTWLDKGFEMTDSLLNWCADNEMYLILDMHGTPGGQGKNADISDYDSTKLSLWESVENQDKLTALWYKLAERYKDEKWIGGYDLINETNWDFENNPNDDNGSSNTKNIPLLNMHKRLIDTIRTIDNNHIVFVSGNSWGNNYMGMDELAEHDDNLSYTFHKYWNANGIDDLKWITDRRDRLNVPLWMSESGENSNTWFADAISLLETNNIGWSWWPVKKAGINSVLGVTKNESYNNLIKYWKGEISTAPSEEEAFQAVLEWADNHRIENCEVNYDVIDAMMFQPHSLGTQAFAAHELDGPIYFSDYDKGRNGYAYLDKDYANYGAKIYVAWNQGWAYRNDGVDIEECTDTISNGYNVGWTADDEWLQYTLQTDSAAAYTFTVRHASNEGGSQFYIEANGNKVTETLSLPNTKGWTNWQTANFEGVLIPAGTVKLKFVFEKGGSNLNYFSLTDPKSATNVEFYLTSAQTLEGGERIMLGFNTEVSTPSENIQLSDFTFQVNGVQKDVTSVALAENSENYLVLTLGEKVHSNQTLLISYNGTSVKSGTQNLEHFTNQKVENNLPEVFSIPSKIQAEDFYINSGFDLETCNDVGGGQNTSYASAGDYLIYPIYVSDAGWFKIRYRVATIKSDAKILFQVENGRYWKTVSTMDFESTGGWQTWKTQMSGAFYLEQGYYSIRLYVKQSEYNLNWFLFTATTSSQNIVDEARLKVYPNPVNAIVNLDLHSYGSGEKIIQLFDVKGQLVESLQTQNNVLKLNIPNLKSGLYLLQVSNKNKTEVIKLVKK